MNNTPLFSVIVPAYNAEKFIMECAQSVLAQTVDDWELILVDDGSKDQTPALCDKLAADDPRILAIHQTNGGEYESRKSGIKAAKGEYLLFLDADDLYPKHYLEKLKVAVAQKPDVITWDIVKFNDADEAYKKLIDDVDTDLAGKITSHELQPVTLDTVAEAIAKTDFSMCNKAFKHSLFDSLDMDKRPQIRYSEDSLMSIGLMCMSKTRICLSNVGYLYRIHAGAVSAQIKTEKLKYLMEAATYHKAVLQNNDMWNEKTQKALYVFLLRYVSDNVYTFETNKCDCAAEYKNACTYGIYNEAKPYETISNMGIKAWIILKLFRFQKYGLLRKIL